MRINSSMWTYGGVFVINTLLHQVERLAHWVYLQRVRLLITAALFLGLAMMTAQAFAGTATSDETPAAMIRETAENKARELLTEPGITLGVNADLDSRTRLPSCHQPLTVDPFSRSNTTITLKVACVDQAGWHIYVPVRLTRKAVVVITAQSLPAGTVLTAQQLWRQERDLNSLPIGYSLDTQPLIGQILRRPLNMGQVVTLADVSAPTRVRRGETVTLVARSGAVEARSQGKALSDAAVDASIRVENLLSRRVMAGRVRADGAVDVIP